MKIIMAVVADLLAFASAPLSAFRTAPVQHVDVFEQHLKNAMNRLPAPRVLLPAQAEMVETVHGTVWVTTVAPLYMQPAYEVDTKLGTVPFATKLDVTKSQAGWAKVEYNKLSGWIPARFLATDPSAVKATFASGESVSEGNESVHIVRLAINDEFSAASTSPVLLDIEYAYYRLVVEGRIPLWPSDRPRLAGTWQHLLRGKAGIHMSVRPLTNTVMEWTDARDSNIAYVEAVTPDERITIAGIYGPDKTVFLRQEFPVESWREWRPVFISVT